MGWSLGDSASCQTKPLTAYMGVVLSGQIPSFVSDWQRFSECTFMLSSLDFRNVISSK